MTHFAGGYVSVTDPVRPAVRRSGPGPVGPLLILAPGLDFFSIGLIRIRNIIELSFFSKIIHIL